MGSLGFLWFSWVFSIFLSYKGHFGSNWVHVSSHGYLWVPLGLVGSPRFLELIKVFVFPKDIFGQIGYMWVLMGISVFLKVWWVPLGFLGFS